MNKITKFLIITFAILGLNLSLELSAINYADKASAAAEFRKIMKSTDGLSGTRLREERKIQIERLQTLKNDLEADDESRRENGIDEANTKLIINVRHRILASTKSSSRHRSVPLQTSWLLPPATVAKSYAERLLEEQRALAKEERELAKTMDKLEL